MDRRASLHNASHRSPFIVPADEVKMAAAKSSSLETILLHRYRNFFSLKRERRTFYVVCAFFFLMLCKAGKVNESE